VAGATITIAHATILQPPHRRPPKRWCRDRHGCRVSQPVGRHTAVFVVAPGRTSTSTVIVQIFTTAFRLVQQQEFKQIPLGTDLPPVNLVDKSGKPLASGLYYVVVTVDARGRSESCYCCANKRARQYGLRKKQAFPGFLADGSG